MKVDVKNDSQGDVAPGSNTPSINKKKATTDVLIRDGETTVIGGILQITRNESDRAAMALEDPRPRVFFAHDINSTRTGSC